jgi:hypothetical protein
MSPTCLHTKEEGEVTCEPEKSSLLTQMKLEVTKFINGEVQVFVDLNRTQVLQPVDVMCIQHAVEDAFHELLASLPDEAYTRKKWHKEHESINYQPAVNRD